METKKQRWTRTRSILKLKVNGPSIKPGRIPIPELLVLCEKAQSAINRQADALRGRPSVRRGRPTVEVKNECTLELFAIGKGSAVMSFAAPEPPPDSQQELDLEIDRLGVASVREVIASIQSLKADKGAYIDPGVRRSLQDMGVLLSNGLTTIEWSTPSLKGRRRNTVVFDRSVSDRLNEPSTSPSQIPVEIDGRLEMADFQPSDLKCIIHTSEGHRTTCSFHPDLEEEVYVALRHIARVKGTATINPITKRPDHITLSSVVILDPFLGRLSEEFFSGLSIEQLTKAQGVDPTYDLRKVGNVWPDEDDIDTFLAGVYERRS
jgi:hypothetical protein